ncbi:uncharacterized protein LOC108440940 [Pygocentrus nattereri]|uniref:uncharacterized protein LOC108440940 n=1 Tax=Pygocentrus nattereri TaxID=42514 RepID=UPI0018913D58|nr:uncharacterized protein LOC108440940 [Pygocentrus nattereri]
MVGDRWCGKLTHFPETLKRFFTLSGLVYKDSYLGSHNLSKESFQGVDQHLLSCLWSLCKPFPVPSSIMYFLHTIVEDDESEMFLQRSLLGQEELAQSTPQAVRGSQRLASSVACETGSTPSEERQSTGKPQRRGSRHSLPDLATVALRVQADLRKQYEEPVQRRSSSTQRTSGGFSGTASPPTARRASRSRSVGRLSGPVERNNDESKDDFPAPQWVINLMIDIEEATQHELTVE